MANKAFGGDKKLPMKSLLARYERKLIDNSVHRFPHWIEGYHLTLMTVHWSIGLIIFGWLARNNHHWLCRTNCPSLQEDVPNNKKYGH